jgi:hypothetical protein
MPENTPQTPEQSSEIKIVHIIEGRDPKTGGADVTECAAILDNIEIVADLSGRTVCPACREEATTGAVKTYVVGVLMNEATGDIRDTPTARPLALELEYTTDAPTEKDSSAIVTPPECEGFRLAGYAGFPSTMPRHTEPKPATFQTRISGLESKEFMLCALCLTDAANMGRLEQFNALSFDAIPGELRVIAGQAFTLDDSLSKKEQILTLYEAGITDIAQIVRKVAARPSYVAQVLQAAGLITGYFDLYTTTAREQNVYSRFFQNVLDFKTPERARASVVKIDRLFNYFERLGDRAGQHQAMILALTGKNRARWSDRMEESEIFSEWLNSH